MINASEARARLMISRAAKIRDELDDLDAFILQALRDDKSVIRVGSLSINAEDHIKRILKYNVERGFPNGAVQIYF